MDKALIQFVDRVADATPDDLFSGLHRLCDSLVGVRLFTCSAVSLAAGTAERIYSNDPVTYPLTGLKDIVPNRWTRQVLDQRKPFLAHGVADLRDIFPDHEKIGQLGLGATINLPIFLSRQLLGTVNLLHTDGHYSDRHVKALKAAVLPATLAFLARERATPNPA